MTLDFQPLGVDDQNTGQIGFLICISCSILGLSVAFFTDRVRKHMKVSYIIKFFENKVLEIDGSKK